jgi:tryptophanyl-tRNA synthetase
MAKNRILTGVRPTGEPHIGNLEGMFKNCVKLQEEYECFFMVADLHALSSEYADPARIVEYGLAVVADWIAAGVDPEKHNLFIQSEVTGHSELYAVLSMITPLPWLERCPTYKEQRQEIKDKDLNTFGFLGYPVLQAADILVYRADTVPVGQDQLPHLELTREIARRFNHLFGEVFPEPQAKLTQAPRLPGIDNRKMSKSYGNAIYMADSPEDTAGKIMRMFTDPKKLRRGDKGNPDGCVVYAYHKIYNAPEVEQLEADCRSGALDCVPCKKRLAEKMNQELAGHRERRTAILADPKGLAEILARGKQAAQVEAAETIRRVHEVVGLKRSGDKDG